MAQSKICLRWVAARPLYQNPYRNHICSAARIYGLRLYATAAEGKPAFIPKQKQRIPIQNAAVSKRKPPPPILNPLMSSSAPDQNAHVALDAAKQAPRSQLYMPLIRAKPRYAWSKPNETMSPEEEHKARHNYIIPRMRIALGLFIVSLIAYSILTAPPPPLQTEGPSILDRDRVSKHESGITSHSPMRLRMEDFVKSQQSEIVSALESLDPSHKFRTDTWTREAGGEGISRVLQNGKIFEKAGVNTSIVYGTLPRPAIEKMRVNHKAIAPNAESLEFFAAGISLVLHPQNPMVPTVHLNYRYFETIDAEGGSTAWFGGGTDLTPSYLFDEDVIHFHRTIKDACDKHDRDYYPRFKEWCDKYFRILHRNESRGVGGIFFDDLDISEKDQEQLFSFIKDCASAFLPSYIPVVQKRKDLAFTEQEKEWQQLRRGRYVEFNLVNDRGTQFGLQTPSARVESILMSLPLTARWMYMHEPAKGSREERLVGVLKKPVDWI